MSLCDINAAWYLVGYVVGSALGLGASWALLWWQYRREKE